MKILVTGSSGFIGRVLVEFLRSQGHAVRRLVRREPLSPGLDIFWDPAAGVMDATALEGFDGVVHLGGESVLGWWTAAKKTRIRESRVKSTQFLCGALSRVSRAPRVLACASAIGYYGSRREEVLTEESPSGSGFLAEVCREWEKAAEPARQKGIRVVHLRFGIVLGQGGGALSQMLLPFKMGLGGRLGDGRHTMSWISLEDVLSAILYVLGNENLKGPVNIVSPHPVTNLEFTKTLARALKRPAVLPFPASAARLLLGEMADEMFLSSLEVQPARLAGSGYSFRHPDLGEALKDLLKP